VTLIEFNYAVTDITIISGIGSLHSTDQEYMAEKFHQIVKKPAIDNGEPIAYGYRIHTEKRMQNVIDSHNSAMENKTYYSHSVDLNFTLNNAASKVTYSLDGKENVTLAEKILLSGLANGDHNVTVYAMDEAGNIESQTIYFTIAEPFPTADVAAVSVAVAAVVVLVCWSTTSAKAKAV